MNNAMEYGCKVDSHPSTATIYAIEARMKQVVLNSGMETKIVQRKYARLLDLNKKVLMKLNILLESGREDDLLKAL